MENPTTLLIALGLTIAIWLLLRPVVLWYFKVNRIEELLEQQINLIKQIHKDRLTEVEEAENKVDELYLEGVVFTLPDYLDFREKDIIRARAQKLRTGQLLSIHNINHEVKFWLISDYKEHAEKINNNTLSIVAIKE